MVVMAVVVVLLLLLLVLLLVLMLLLLRVWQSHRSAWAARTCGFSIDTFFAAALHSGSNDLQCPHLAEVPQVEAEVPVEAVAAEEQQVEVQVEVEVQSGAPRCVELNDCVVLFGDERLEVLRVQNDDAALGRVLRSGGGE